MINVKQFYFKSMVIIKEDKDNVVVIIKEQTFSQKKAVCLSETAHYPILELPGLGHLKL